MDPKSMEYTCGPSPLTPLWTQSMDYSCGSPLLLWITPNEELSWVLFCAWFVSRIQYVCQPIHTSKGYEGREVLGGYSIIVHYLFISILPCIRFWVDLHATQWHPKKTCISEYLLHTSPHIPFIYCFSFQTKPLWLNRTHKPMYIQEKIEQVYKKRSL